MSTTNSLLITLAQPSYPDSGPWMRLTQLGAGSDAVSPSDASGVIDAIYAITPCEEGKGTGGKAVQYDANGNIIPPVTVEEFVDIVEENLDIKACVVKDDFSWDAQVEVVRSDPTLPYTLQVTGAAVIGTVPHNESRTVNLIIDHAQQIELPYPPVGPVTGGWSGGRSDMPAWTLHGTTVYLSSDATGQLDLTYQTNWDIVTVHVDGKEGETELQDAEILCFWNRMAEVITVRPPDTLTDEKGDIDICKRTVRSNPSEEEEKEDAPCYRTITRVYRCSCSDRFVDFSEQEETVPCPKGVPDGSHIIATDINVTEYVDCGESTPHPVGGYLSDPEFYEQVCCFPPNRPLPPCSTIHRTWRPGAEIKPNQDYWLNQNQGNVELVAVAPKEGICGELVQTWEVGGNCCDVAPPVTYNWTDSSSVIADNSFGVVFWQGGLPPYSIQLLNQTGFWTNSAKNATAAATTNTYAYIYTSNACGSCDVTITDACGQSVAGSVRSPDGQWVQVLANWHPSAAIGGCTWTGGCQSTWCTSESIQGRFKVRRESHATLMYTNGYVLPVQPFYSNQYFRTDVCGGQPVSQYYGSMYPSIGHDPGDCSIPGINEPGPTSFVTSPTTNIHYYMQYCSAIMYYPGYQWNVWEWRC